MRGCSEGGAFLDGGTHKHGRQLHSYSTLHVPRPVTLKLHVFLDNGYTLELQVLLDGGSIRILIFMMHNKFHLVNNNIYFL
jgi:hypothetical protein